MITVKKEGIILEKTHFEFENEGVLNPGAIKEGDHVHLFLPGCTKWKSLKYWLLYVGWTINSW